MQSVEGQEDDPLNHPLQYPAGLSYPLEGGMAAYVHIPFCRRRCYYCDFPVSIVGDLPPVPQADPSSQYGAIAQYLPILCREIQQTEPLGQPLQTVFLGGGTPSLLTPVQFEQILATLDQQFGIAANAEISIEMDPDTFDLEKLRGYVALGVNRVSLGVQAFQAHLLQACGRTHTPDDIQAAIHIIHQVGLQNYSLDLISGLPHQTLRDWQDSLHQAIALNPPHISVYDLTVEPQTAFHRWYEPGAKPLPTDATTAEMYRTAQRILTQAGYDHYEISNYAKPGYQCRHNRVYWKNQSHYGFGMGATSYLHKQRISRPRTRREYFDWVNQQAIASKQSPPLTQEDEFLETLMVGLRLAEGVDLKTLHEQFGDARVNKLLSVITPYQHRNWICCHPGEIPSHHDSSHTPLSRKSLSLTDPEGFLFSNVILSSIFQAFETQG